MKTKKILRFYFAADSLEKAFSNVIERSACAPNCDGEATAEKICGLIGEKMKLERLWAYLDGVLGALTAREREILSSYSRRGKMCINCDRERKEVQSTVIKFTRRARRIDEFCEDISVLNKYYCLLR